MSQGREQDRGEQVQWLRGCRAHFEGTHRCEVNLFINTTFVSRTGEATLLSIKIKLSGKVDHPKCRDLAYTVIRAMKNFRYYTILHFFF